MARDPHTKRKTPSNLRLLVATLRETANVSEAARRVGISRWLAYDWRRQAEETGRPAVALDDGTELPLHEAWDSALEAATDDLERVARMLATGHDEPLVHQGRVTMRLDDETMEMVPETIRRYDAGLLQFLLKGRRPEVYRDNINVRHDAAGGVLVVPAAVDPEAWAKAVEEQQASARKGNK